MTTTSGVAIDEARRAAIVLARAFDLGRIVLVDENVDGHGTGRAMHSRRCSMCCGNRTPITLCAPSYTATTCGILFQGLRRPWITWSTSVSRGLALLLALALGCGALGGASTRRWHGRLRAARRSVWTMLGARRFLLVSEVLAQAPTVALSVWHPPVLAPSNGRPRRRRPRGWRPR